MTTFSFSSRKRALILLSLSLVGLAKLTGVTPFLQQQPTERQQHSFLHRNLHHHHHRHALTWKEFKTSTAIFSIRTQQQQQKSRGSSRGHNPCIAINKKIIELGSAKDWRGILQLFLKEGETFNNVNYSTALVQLGRIRSLDRSDPRFLAMLDSLLENMETRGFSWIQGRSTASIIYVIGKMKMKNPSAQRILAWVSREDIVNQFVEEAIQMGDQQSIANTVWAFATLKMEAPKLFSAVEAQSDWLVENGSTQGVANTAWAFATLKMDAPKLFSAIEAHSEWLVKNGNPQEITNTAWAFATLKTDAPKLLAAIEARSEWLIENGDPQSVANIAWALATLQHGESGALVENGNAQEIANTVRASETLKTSKLLSAIEARSDWLVQNGSAQCIANTAWAFAKLKTAAPQLLAAIEARSAWLVENGNTQNLANTAWAFATLKTAAPRLLSAVEARSHWLVHNGKAQEVANTVWAFAALKTEAPLLLSAIEARSDWLVENGNAQDIANTVWAFATLKIEAPKLLTAIEARSAWLGTNGTPQNLANTAWAFATLKAEAPKLLSAIEARAGWLVDNGSTQDVANTVWAFAALKTGAPKLLSAIEARSGWLVENGNTRDVAHAVWAFATLNTEAPKLFSVIETRSDWLVENGNTLDVAHAAWAFAINGFEATQFYDALHRNPMALFGKESSLQTLANVCYAVAISGRVSELVDLLLNVWDAAIQLFMADAIFNDEDLFQLFQTRVYASAWGVDLPAFPEALTRQMEKALQANTIENNVVSRSSKDISMILKEIGFDHECEVAPEPNVLGGMLAIDFACVKRKLAIEYDGPSHFLNALSCGELTTKRNGSTKAKSRLLEQLGWTVINLDFRDYRKACQKSQEKDWLRVELKQAGVTLP